MALTTRVFDLEAGALTPDTTRLSSDPVTIRTPAGAWAYAMWFVPNWPAEAARVEGFVDVAIRVLDGDVSLLSVDERDRVLDEHLVGAGPDRRTLSLAASPLTHCRRVVVRNGASDMPATLQLFAIEHKVAGTVDDPDGVLAPPPPPAQPITDWPRYYTVHGMTPRDRLRAAHYATFDQPRIMRSADGFLVRLQPRDDLSRVIYLSGTYEPESLAVVARLLPVGGTFIDVGANAGLFSMIASRRVAERGRVFAFEPSEREYLRLVDHVSLNSLTNVTPQRLVIADRDGPVTLQVAAAPNAGQNTTADRFVYELVKRERLEVVDGTSLDSFVRRERLAAVDLIKIDVEGGEAKVFSGMAGVLASLRPAVIFEAVEEALSPADATIVFETLIRADYRIFRIEADGGDLRPHSPTDPLPGANLVALPSERAVS